MAKVKHTDYMTTRYSPPTTRHQQTPHCDQAVKRMTCSDTAPTSAGRTRSEGGANRRSVDTCAFLPRHAKSANVLF